MDRRVDFLGASESERIDRIKNLDGRSAADKMSKAEAEYQDSPKDIRMCATCSLFEPPRACKVGDVSPYGWCKVFALAD